MGGLGLAGGIQLAHNGATHQLGAAVLGAGHVAAEEVEEGVGGVEGDVHVGVRNL